MDLGVRPPVWPPTRPQPYRRGRCCEERPPITSTTSSPPRPAADRIARRLLRVERTDPGALLPLQGSLLISAVRCILTYVVVPVALPVVGLATAIATPASVLLLVAAVGLSVRSLRRVWIADYGHRWAYTAFIAVVILLQVAAIVVELLSVVG